MGTIFLAGPVVIGQGVMVLNCKRVDLISGSNFLQWGWSNTGAVCPGR